MRQIKEVLRLYHESGLSRRAIADSTGLARSTVGDYLSLYQRARISWPIPESMSESDLQERLRAARPPAQPDSPVRPLPDWSQVHRELARKNVTLVQLWKEYRQEYPDGYGRSQFFVYYRRWVRTLDPSLRQIHAPGEKMFVDWAGATVPIGDSKSGESCRASIFVAALGFSQKIFVRAYPDQKLPSWIDAHVKAFEYYGGVSRLVVPDNPKTAVTRACRYEPAINRTYQDLAAHYQCAILPARPRSPRDKAKAESAVQIVQNQILAALRNRTFFSLSELNEAIAQKLEGLNRQPFSKLSGSRQEAYVSQEKNRLRPLPGQPYEQARWKEAKVNIDYHVAIDRHFYSVPWKLIHQKVQVRLSRTLVEIHHNGLRVAAHQRSHQPGRFTTISNHLPRSHQKHLQWSPGRLIHWARSVGPICARATETILKSRPHPEQGYRACLGLMRLARSVGAQRMEAACQRALRHGTCSFTSIRSILENKLDQLPRQEQQDFSAPEHSNLRGADYYR